MSTDLGRDVFVEKLNDMVVLKKLNIKLELPLCRWKLLIFNFDTIDQAIADIKSGKKVSMRLHIGGNVYVSISNEWPMVDIRQFWLPPNGADVSPTRKGVNLKFYQYEKLKDAKISVPEDVEICYAQSDHQNQLGAINCLECNPNQKMWEFY